MASGNSGAGRHAYVRLLLLILGEVIAGVLLYALFTLVPFAVQMTIAVAGWLVIVNDNLDPLKNKSLASMLCGFTAAPTVFCAVAWRITHEDVWSRLMLVGSCLMAALIFLDRRQDD